MLEEIRHDKKKSFTQGLVIVAGVGMLFIGLPNYFRTSQYAMKINGEEINYRTYQNTYSEYQQRLPNTSEHDISLAAQRAILMRTVLKQHAFKSPYRLPDEELYEIIENLFGDKKTYAEALQRMQTNPNSYQMSVQNEQRFLQYYRMNSSIKWQEASGEWQRTLKLLADERNYEVATLKIDDEIAKIIVDDAELKTFFDEHKENYKIPEAVDISYTIFDNKIASQLPAPSDEEISKVLADSITNKKGKRAAKYLIFNNIDDANNALLALKKDPAAFQTLSDKIKNKDISGEIGNFELQEYGKVQVPVIDDALFALSEVGQISEILTTDYGSMILLADAIEQPTAETIKNDLMKEAKDKYIYELSSKAADLAASGASIEQISKLANTEIVQLTNINSKSENKYLQNEELRKQLFGEDKELSEKVLDPITINNSDLLFVSINKRYPESYLEFETIKDKVTDDYKRLEASKHLQKQADDIITALKEGKNLSDFDLSITEIKNVNIFNPLAHQDINIEDLYNQAGKFAITNNKHGDILLTVLVSVKEGDVNKIPPEMVKILQVGLEKEFSEGIFDDLATYLAKSAKVKVNPQITERE